MRTVNYNEYQLSGKERLMNGFFLILSLAVTGNLFFHSVLPVLLFPVLLKKTEKIYMSYAVKKRKKKLLLQYRDLLYELSSSFSSGRHMEEALSESLEKMKYIYSEDADIILEISAMLEGIKRGRTDLEVFEDFSTRADIDDIREFVMVFRVCRETGGNFISVLNHAASLIGEKIILENDIKTMMIQKENEGYIITVMPFIILFFLRLTSPSYLMPMYETAAGRIIMTGALLLIIAAYRIILKITKVEI